jgi:hypothetical protein
VVRGDHNDEDSGAVSVSAAGVDNLDNGRVETSEVLLSCNRYDGGGLDIRYCCCSTECGFG